MTWTYSTIFVLHSLYEGFCVAAVEAMAGGLSVMGSNNPVFKEVIGSIGSFVPCDRSN